MKKEKKGKESESVIYQTEHFFSPGDGIVLLGDVYKRASYNDVVKKNRIYIVAKVINKSSFTIKG